MVLCPLSLLLRKTIFGKNRQMGKRKVGTAAAYCCVASSSHRNGKSHQQTRFAPCGSRLWPVFCPRLGSPHHLHHIDCVCVFFFSINFSSPMLLFMLGFWCTPLPVWLHAGCAKVCGLKEREREREWNRTGSKTVSIGDRDAFLGNDFSCCSVQWRKKKWA